MNPLVSEPPRQEAPLDISVSEELQDPAWDRFLESTPRGQFQQSSLWARVKQKEGWKPVRLLCRIQGEIAGGVQILTQRKRYGSIGYISKGPVLDSEDATSAQRILDRILLEANRRGLLALIIQPPDDSELFPNILRAPPFSPNALMRIVESTLINDLGKEFEATLNGVSASTRKNVRRAPRRGITIREGNERDVPRFFELMAQTCQRQGTSPNPSTVDLLHEVFRQFSAARSVRMTMAEAEGRTVACMLTILFNGTLTLWKKGSDAAEHSRHPNEALIMEALEWGTKNRFRQADFLALRKDIAVSISEGRELTEEQNQARDLFNLGFGGSPKFLPSAHVYIPNRLIRRIYTLLCSNASTLRLLKKIAK